MKKNNRILVSHTLAHTLPHSHTFSLSHTLSLTHTHTHTRTQTHRHSLTHTHKCPLSLSLSLSLPQVLLSTLMPWQEVVCDMNDAVKHSSSGTIKKY